MKDTEVDIFMQTEEGEIYPLDVPKSIKYKDLKEKIKEKVFKIRHFYIVFNNKEYREKEGDEIIHFKNGNIIYSFKTISLECNVHVEFHPNTKLDESDKNTVELSGILQISLLKYISKKLDNPKKIKNDELRNIIIELKEDINLKENEKEDIKTNLSNNDGNNLIAYKNYIQEKVKLKEIKYLISLFDQKNQHEINAYWSQLSKYEDFNKLFEKEFSVAIQKSYFDYSLIAISIYQQDRRISYLKKLKECENTAVRYLFHGSQIDPIAKIITNGFLYTRKPFYGMGIYFSDMLDYVSFYCGGSTYKERRDYFGKILPVGKTFSCVGTEVYYDKDKKKNIYDFSLHINELDHFPTYEEIRNNYKEKMVEKNGLHFARVEAEGGQVYDQSSIDSEKKKGKFIGTEYVITEMDQILPLYGLTLKRNEYFVLWRDPHFSGENEYTEFLNNAKMILYKNEKINVYIESCTETALEIIKRKKHNKIILISSIGLDLSGKTFVEAARKILGFEIMVLFFSNNDDHLKWIQNFPNALYTSDTNFYQKYVKNYNKEGLKKLKKEVEQTYKISLNFTSNFFDFPNFINCEEYKNIIFEEICPNFRKIIIKNKLNKKALVMNKDGTVNFGEYEGTKVDPFIWYITLINDEMTLFSNNFYLYVDEQNTVKGFQFMKRWKYENLQINSKYLLYYKNQNNYLTVNGKYACVKGKSNKLIEQLFQFVDL